MTVKHVKYVGSRYMPKTEASGLGMFGSLPVVLTELSWVTLLIASDVLIKLTFGTLKHGHNFLPSGV